LTNAPYQTLHIEELGRRAYSASACIGDVPGRRTHGRREALLVRLDAIRIAQLWGDWNDIPLIIESLSRDNSGFSLLSSDEGVRYDVVAKALYRLGKSNLSNLVLLNMPPKLFAHLRMVIGEKEFSTLGDELLITLLDNEVDRIRKVVALKCVASLPKARIVALLSEYGKADRFRYYSVVHWVDLGASLDRGAARAAARRAMTIGFALS